MPAGTAARTWHVPDDAPTITAGIDSAAAGDTVMLECGTYYEHNIRLDKSGIFITSETGLADCVTINPQMMHRHFIVPEVDSTTTIMGFTLINGWQYNGGSMAINVSTIKIVNCNFVNNTAGDDGGAIAINEGAPIFSGCLFADNSCADDGGAIATYSANTVIRNCTFSGNSAAGGGNIHIGSGYYLPVIKNTILADAVSGGAIDCAGSSPPLTLTHCCIYGNAGGDSLCGDYSQNLFADPVFCDTENPAQPYTIHESSPCAPSNNPWGEWIGAFETGCPSAVEPASWGNVKGMLR
jgi:predicted outer membrane repeat protein